MLFVADAGNTNIKIAVFDNEKILMKARLQTSDSSTPEAFERAVSEILHVNNINRRMIESVAVSTVVPEATKAFVSGIQRLFKRRPLVVDKDTKTGILIKTDNPAELGADRLVNAAAAFHTYGGPVLAIDLGTATTYDVVSEKGEFLGGIIAPGIKLCAQALWEKTERLPEITLEKPDTVMGSNTVSSMKSGVFYGYIGQLEYFVRHLQEEQSMDFKVVATGGYSELFKGHTDAIDVFDPDLTLRGLNVIYRISQRAAEVCA